MADNTVLDVGTGGDTIATDDIAGVKHQRVKVEFGADGAATDVSASNPLPVDQADTATADYDSGAGTVTQTMLGIALPTSGGPVAGGTSTAPVRTDPTGTTAQPVTDNGGSLTVDGTVTANAGTGTFTVGDGGSTISVDDGAGSLTVDGTVTANAGTGDFSVVGKAADGAAVAGNPVLVAGQDGTNAQSISTNTSGHVNIADGGNSITVDVGTALPAGTNNIGDVDVLSLPALPAGTNNIGDVDVLSLPAIPAGSNKIGGVDLDSDAATGSAVPTVAQFVAGTDGTNARALKTDASGELQVDVLSLPAIPAGTNNIGDVDVLTLPALPAGTNNIGDVDVATLPSVSTSSITQVASSATNVTLKASNASRKGLNIFNDSTAALFVKFGATASSTSFTVKIAAGGYYEMQYLAVYTGIVDGIWASAQGNAYVTEL